MALSQLLLEYSSLIEDENLEGPVLDLAAGTGENGLFLASLNLPGPRPVKWCTNLSSIL